MPKVVDRTLTAIVLDFETGGLYCQTCAATQISMHAIRLDTCELMNSMNLYIKPYPYQDIVKPKRKVVKTKWEIEDEEESETKMMEYDPAAMEVSGITKEQLETEGEDLQEVCEKIIEFCKNNRISTGISNKPILVGQNVTFDIGFLQQIMTYTDLYDKFCKVVDTSTDFFGNVYPKYMDTLYLAKLAFGHDKSVTSFKLETIALFLGIEMDDAHDADADVTATEDVFRTFIKRLRTKNGSDVADDTGIVSASKKVKLRDHFKI